MITINIDCKEKTINFESRYREFVTDDQYYEEDISEDENILRFFNEAKSINGFETATIDFEGSGDSGWIQDTMRYNDGNSESVPEFILNYLYKFLESVAGGWEINEGSQGFFELDFEQNLVKLNLGINNEDVISEGSLFFSKF